MALAVQILYLAQLPQLVEAAALFIKMVLLVVLVPAARQLAPQIKQVAQVQQDKEMLVVAVVFQRHIHLEVAAGRAQ